MIHAPLISKDQASYRNSKLLKSKEGILSMFCFRCRRVSKTSHRQAGRYGQYPTLGPTLDGKSRQVSGLRSYTLQRRSEPRNRQSPLGFCSNKKNPVAARKLRTTPSRASRFPKRRGETASSSVARPSLTRSGALTSNGSLQQTAWHLRQADSR